MKKFFLVVVFGLVAACTPARAWHGKVVKVLDGDSLRVARNGRIYEIRLYGIDTPEHRQPYANQARKMSKRLLLGKTVSVDPRDRDRYGRIVALVRSEGRLVNRELVKYGLAWVYPHYCRQYPLCGELTILQKRARKKRRGLWRDARPVPPWVWKHRHSRSHRRRW